MTETQPPDAPAASAPMRQSLRNVMIASLTLNLVVAGVIGGALLSGRDRPVRFGGYDFTLGPFTRALSREDRRTIGEELRNRPELGPQERGSRKAALDTFLAAVAADPFDAAAVSLIFAAQRDRALRGMSAGQEVLLARIVQMTSAERGDFAARLRTELDSRRRR